MPAPTDLHADLEKAFGQPLRLVWTDNRTVYLSLRPPADAATWTLRLHGCFRDAPEVIRSALARFLRTRRRSHLVAVRAYFAGRPRGGTERRRPVVLRPRGHHHDLRPLLGVVADLPLFRELPPVEVTWGARRPAGSRCVRLGSYRRAQGELPAAQALVRVHPLLDSPTVPTIVISSVLHHELVHHLLTCRLGTDAGRRHDAQFRQLERLYPGHGEAERWLGELSRRLGEGPCTRAS